MKFSIRSWIVRSLFAFAAAAGPATAQAQQFAPPVPPPAVFSAPYPALVSAPAVPSADFAPSAVSSLFAPPELQTQYSEPVAADELVPTATVPNGFAPPAPPVQDTAPFRLIADKATDFAGFEERIKELEDARKKDADAAKKKKSDDASKPTIKISARIHTDYWAFPDVDPSVGLLETADGDPNDRFLFRRIRLGVSGEIPDNMLYKMDIDFNNPNSPQLKDVYLGWSEVKWFRTVLLGHQKRPYGLDHLNSSNTNIFLERPLVVEGFNQDTRRWGLTSNGVSDNERFNWRYGFYMSQDMQNTGTDLSSLNEDYQGEFAGRFANTWWYDESSEGRGYGHWAIAGTYGSADGDDAANNVARWQTRPEARTSARWLDTGSITFADDYQLLALENVWNWGSVQLTSEYQQMWVGRHGGGTDVAFDGGYAQLAWVLTGEHHPWDRATGTLKPLKPFENFWLVNMGRGRTAAGWGAWELAARASYANFSDSPFFGGKATDLTLGLQWFWNQNARLQFNYTFGHMEDRFNANNLAQPRNGDYQIGGVRFIIFM